MRNLVVGATVLMLLATSPGAYAASAFETLKTDVHEVLAVLRDPNLKAPSAKKLREEKILAVVEPMFDELELSRRSLARNWEKFTSDQQGEFVMLFRKVLENAYLDKILAYTDEKVLFDKEITLSPDRAEVETRIVTASKEIPITYRLILKNGRWKVYDVVIEGVSLVQNYRSQFNELLVRNSPEEVLGMLRKKVEGTEQGVGKPS
jgi:phospholipid transport system substrate-binding protein